MFDGFDLRRFDTGEATLRVRVGGAGPPLLLLHGHPQTPVMWHRIAPDLAREFTVVAPDLRGYGESSKPATTDDHEPYSKRAMARDMVALMTGLGHERLAVAGHDRGGRCAYRLALNHPERVERLAVLDITPAAATDSLDPEALDDYLRCIRNPETIHAMCEDYRAGATFDNDLDEADRGRRRIACPLLVLWSTRGELSWWDPLAIWSGWADDVTGTGIDCGHYLAEEVPEATYRHLRDFFTSS